MNEVSTPTIEPFLMSVLSSRFEAISREMVNTMLKAGRSGVINVARDFSCTLLTGDGRQVTTGDSLPIHTAAADLQIKFLLDLFEDIEPGDCFLNNCPYLGNSHHADMTLCVPVFYKEELAFWALTRAHHADVGAPIPTTYLPFAKTIYEEGVHAPCVRVQRKGKDIPDIIRLFRTKIRVPDQWYGDYLAEVGSVRIAERRLTELCDKYGLDLIKTFMEEWFAYGERRMIAAIGRLPAGTWEEETCHDPVPGVAPEGVPVKVRLTIDPENATIDVDLRDNTQSYPGGLNLSEATVRANCYMGVFDNLDPDMPHNHGSFKRIRVHMNDGVAIGRPKFPIGTSCATTNVSDRLGTIVAVVFAKVGEGYGFGEGGIGMSPSLAVVSGHDDRRGADFVNQLISGYGGGPATHGHDGWLTFATCGAHGVLRCDSLEINELKYPILYKKMEILEDSPGAGQWDGAPGVETIYGPVCQKMRIAYTNDGHFNRPKGARGGKPGGAADAFKITKESRWEPMPQFGEFEFSRGELVVSRACGGGGYGDPLLRDPERVCHRVTEGWVSAERAKEVYGVDLCEKRGEWEVDWQATEKLRTTLRKSQGRTATERRDPERGPQPA